MNLLLKSVSALSFFFLLWMPVWQPWQYRNTNWGTFGLQWQIYDLQQPADRRSQADFITRFKHHTHRENIGTHSLPGCSCWGVVCTFPIWLCGNLHQVWLRWRATWTPREQSRTVLLAFIQICQQQQKVSNSWTWMDEKMRAEENKGWKVLSGSAGFHLFIYNNSSSTHSLSWTTECLIPRGFLVTKWIYTLLYGV